MDADTIMIVDKIGCLRAFYSMAKIVFIGKTFTIGGGQNMIEPLFFGKPTFVGPLTQNFTDIVNIFLRKKVLVQVNTENELLASIIALLRDSKRIQQISFSAKREVLKHQGAARKTMEEIIMLLQ